MSVDARSECVSLLASLGQLLEVPVTETASTNDGGGVAANATTSEPNERDAAAVAAQTIVVDDVLTLCEHGVDPRRIAAALTARCETAVS